MLLETVAVVSHQDSELTENGSPARYFHQSRPESRRPMGHGPQTGRPARYDQQVAKGSRSHICQRTVGEDPSPGYGPVTSSNRPVRTRMPGGVGAGGLRPPATRLGTLRIFQIFGFPKVSNKKFDAQFCMNTKPFIKLPYRPFSFVCTIRTATTTVS